MITWPNLPLQSTSSGRGQNGTTGGLGLAAGLAAAGLAAGLAAADLAAAENREHFEEVRSCIEALTMQVAKPYPTLHPIHRSSLSHPTDRLHPSTQLTPI